MIDSSKCTLLNKLTCINIVILLLYYFRSKSVAIDSNGNYVAIYRFVLLSFPVVFCTTFADTNRPLFFYRTFKFSNYLLSFFKGCGIHCQVHCAIKETFRKVSRLRTLAFLDINSKQLFFTLYKKQLSFSKRKFYFVISYTISPRVSPRALISQKIY